MPLAPQQFAGLTHLASGKVRELFAVAGGASGGRAGGAGGGRDAGKAGGLAGEMVLMVVSDRISAFDVVLPTEIPDKGAVLTALSLWWFEQLADIVPSHVISSRVEDYPAQLQAHADALRGRSMLCRRLDMVPVECVARGYLTGSGLADYERTGSVSGHVLPPGLRDGDRLPEPIYTPSTKAPQGEHDENITRADVVGRIGPALAKEIERLTLDVYRRASVIGRARGVLLADTKLEFGHDSDGVLRLGDEVLTPDSSRFWRADAWEPGRAQSSFDKQYVRDWLAGSGWDRRAPGPELPADVVEQTRARYVEAYERLTGHSFDDYLRAA